MEHYANLSPIYDLIKIFFQILEAPCLYLLVLIFWKKTFEYLNVAHVYLCISYLYISFCQSIDTKKRSKYSFYIMQIGQNLKKKKKKKSNNFLFESFNFLFFKFLLLFFFLPCFSLVNRQQLFVVSPSERITLLFPN